MSGPIREQDGVNRSEDCLLASTTARQRCSSREGSSVWPQFWPGGQPPWIGWDDGVVTTWSSVVVPTSSAFGLPVFDQHVIPVHHLGLTSDERSFIDVLLVDLESSQPWG